MKVLLITPPDENKMFALFPTWQMQADSTRRYPPMGLLYIAASILEYTDHEVEALDAQIEHSPYEAIEKKIREYEPDVVGITGYTTMFLDTVKVARIVKAVNPDIFIVVGGPHASVYPSETAMLDDVDVAISGEGEEVMVELLDALSVGRPLETVPGLYLPGTEGAIITPKRDPIADLDSLPFPARHLLPKEAFRFTTDKEKYSTTIISSRGCRFKCIYCDIPYHYIRARSPKNVVDEISECVGLGIMGFNFCDDSFNFDENRVVEVCRDILERDLKIRFSIRARVDKINRDMLDWLYKAGCRRINFGVEAGDDEALKKLKKGITTEMARRSVRLTREAGIETCAFFMLGLPGQTKEGIYRTIDFAIELDPDYAQFNYIVLCPGTELYSEALRQGAFEKDFLLEFAKSPAPMDIISYWENPVSLEDVIQYTKIAYRKFYLRPSYIWKQLKKLQSFRDLARRGFSGYMVLAYSLLPWGIYRPQIAKKEVA